MLLNRCFVLREKLLDFSPVYTNCNTTRNKNACNNLNYIS